MTIAAPAPATTTAAATRARKEVVVDEMHGVTIEDPYRWLEDDESAETRAFVDAQNAATRAALDSRPTRAAVKARLTELLSIGTLGTPAVRYSKGRPARYFFTRRSGGENQPVLYVRDGLGGADRALVDPNALAADGTTAIDWWVPSRDGRLLAYGLSQGGTEDSTLLVRDVETGKDLPDRAEHARYSSIAWTPDGKGFYYARYPRPGDVPAGEELYHRKIYFMELGATPEDPLVYAPKDMKDWPSVALSPDGRWLVVSVFQGWSKSEVWLRDLAKRDAPFVPVAAGVEAIYEPEILDDLLLLRTNDGAPRYRVVAVDPRHPERARWREIIAQGDDVLDGMAIVGKRIVASTLAKAHARVRLFALDGAPAGEIPLPAIGTVVGIGGEWDGPEVFLGFESYAVPPTILRHDVRAAATDVWQRVEAPIDPSLFEVEQRSYASTDGASISLFLVHKKGLARDGTNPTLLYGYGGFNVSLTPTFSRTMSLFLERGGVYAVPNLRGGGEYGEDWHRAGMLGKKQQVFDDFLAAARWLIDQKITSPERLAISGRSNGGLLVGAAITQAPSLFRAAVCGVPLLDMLRYDRFLLAKLWIAEYGAPGDPEAFEWLRAYSPYHRVADGTPYPAVIFTTAEGDTRVDPMHARKMAARMQAATSSGRPVLLRVERKAGHGAGKPLALQIEELTDEWTFLLWQLGLE
ncbi:MAG: prolyl oligopeptidase family serine peptidase [Myxococcota bacterium]